VAKGIFRGAPVAGHLSLQPPPAQAMTCRGLVRRSGAVAARPFLEAWIVFWEVLAEGYADPRSGRGHRELLEFFGAWGKCRQAASAWRRCGSDFASRAR
jgi:hypothetical protein